mmetsp:Transcript_31804/g.44344  ORF Transcript_31804/g.44344 Transcript_31804/m.44344 type:complete len:81 (+) Transcript_31804:451-693(+)
MIVRKLIASSGPEPLGHFGFPSSLRSAGPKMEQLQKRLKKPTAPPMHIHKEPDSIIEMTAKKKPMINCGRPLDGMNTRAV